MSTHADPGETGLRLHHAGRWNREGLEDIANQSAWHAKNKGIGPSRTAGKFRPGPSEGGGSQRGPTTIWVRYQRVKRRRNGGDNNHKTNRPDQ